MLGIQQRDCKEFHLNSKLSDHQTTDCPAKIGDAMASFKQKEERKKLLVFSIIQHNLLLTNISIKEL